MQPDLSINQVVEACRQRAFDYQAKAAQVRASGDRDKDLEYSAKAQAINQLIEEILPRTGPSQQPSDQEIDALARRLEPKLYASFDALVSKLRLENHDDGYVVEAVEAIYGESLSQAREKAQAALTQPPSPSNGAAAAYAQGVADAVKWHIRHARLAEAMEAKEQDPSKKNKLRQRAARHKLYADAMRTDFEKAQRASEAHPGDQPKDPNQPSLFGAEQSGRRASWIFVDD